MIRAPRLLPDSPIHRLLLIPNPPRFHRRLSLRPPLSASLAQTLASTSTRGFASSRLAPLCLLMDPAMPASAADIETNGYEDASEFADAEAGGEDAGAGMTAGGEERRELPEELAKGVVCLECDTSAEAAAAGVGGTCRVYVVGTAHVSEESCDQVKAVIDYLKPQVVFLELCASRVAILTPQNLQTFIRGNCIHGDGCGSLKPIGRVRRSSVIRLYGSIKLHANRSKEVDVIYIGSMEKFRPNNQARRTGK